MPMCQINKYRRRTRTWTPGASSDPFHTFSGAIIPEWIFLRSFQTGHAELIYHALFTYFKCRIRTPKPDRACPRNAVWFGALFGM